MAIECGETVVEFMNRQLNSSNITKQRCSRLAVDGGNTLELKQFRPDSDRKIYFVSFKTKGNGASYAGFVEVGGGLFQL
jgi:hypothetical protein